MGLKIIMIILVHGLMRTDRSMYWLGKYLEKHGYRIHLYRYLSTKCKIAEHGEHLKKFIKNVLNKNSDIKLSFVTHSLGGIITREALSFLSEEELSRCKHLVMLSPPNKGSHLAKFFITFLPFLAKIIKPLSELSSNPDTYVHQVSIPKGVNISIISGKYDTTTPHSRTKLDGNHTHLIVNAGHTFIMNNSNARRAILELLSKD